MIPDILINNTSMFSLGWIRESIDFPTPLAQTETVVIPGRSSPIRFNEALGLISYQPRAFSIVLTMLGSRSEFNEKVSLLINQYSGRLVQVILSEEPDFYYAGTIEFTTSYDPKTYKGQLTMSCNDGDAYKYKVEETVIAIEGSQTITLENDYMPAIPTITTTAQTTLSWTIDNDSFTKTLSIGNWAIPELQLFHGTNEIQVASTGTTTFTYREGRL